MSNNETTGNGLAKEQDVKKKQRTSTYKTLDTVLVLVGSGIVGFVFVGLDPLLKVLGFIGYAMGLYGMLLATKNE